MILLIAGSRGFYNSKDKEVLKCHYKLGLEALENIKTKYNVHEVISGKAKGADTFGEIWAEANSIRVKEFPAEWDKYGKKAGMIRNKAMGDIADIAVIFWDGKSPGSKNMIDYFKSLKKPIYIIKYNEGDYDEW
jgi:hypothetical protein